MVEGGRIDDDRAGYRAPVIVQHGVHLRVLEHTVAGEAGRRDKAAQTASMLVAGLGLEPEAVMFRLLRYEEIWKAGMKSVGLSSPGGL